jgi:hypothetical protein
LAIFAGSSLRAAPSGNAGFLSGGRRLRAKRQPGAEIDEHLTSGVLAFLHGYRRR